MADETPAETRESALEERIEEWRSYLRRRQAIHTVDVEELEDHLRSHVATLGDAGLTPDEAFLVAVKRMGDLDELSREFAREYSERLWKQLVVSPGKSEQAGKSTHTEALVAIGLAIGAAILIKIPGLFGVPLGPGDEDSAFYFRNFSLFVLPLLAGYFAWKRQMSAVGWRWLPVPFLAAAVLANAFPLGFIGMGSATQALVGEAKGAGDRAMFHFWARRTAIWSFLIGIAFAAVYGGGGAAIVAALTDVESVRSAANQQILLVALWPVLAVWRSRSFSPACSPASWGARSTPSPPCSLRSSAASLSGLRWVSRCSASSGRRSGSPASRLHRPPSWGWSRG